MSNHLAIATATAALGQIVLSAAERAVSGAVLKFGRPTQPASGSMEHKVHLYLYQVTPNAALRNADLPTRSAEGRLTRRPQAALDLHYLISFFGNDTDFEPDRMLGAVVRDLHSQPVLSGSAIQNAITNHPQELGSSDLANAIEQVKFTPIQLSLDEMSKLWSVMVQTPHALSVAYMGTVVLIEAEESPEAVLPVLQRGEGDRGVDTRIGPFPRLDSMWVGSPAAAARRPRLPSLPNAQLGTQLVLAGGNLGGDAVRLRVMHVPLQPNSGDIVLLPAREVDIAAADRSADEIRFDIPDDAAAQTDWTAGIYGVVAIVKRGGASQPATSALPLALAPRVTAIQPNPAARSGSGDVTLQITCKPRVLEAQAALLLLADREVASEPFAGSTDALTFIVRNAPLLTGALVRLRVDGVDSLPFKFDETSGRFVFDDQQRITIQ